MQLMYSIFFRAPQIFTARTFRDISPAPLLNPARTFTIFGLYRFRFQFQPRNPSIRSNWQLTPNHIHGLLLSFNVRFPLCLRRSDFTSITLCASMLAPSTSSPLFDNAISYFRGSLPNSFDIPFWYEVASSCADVNRVVRPLTFPST